MSDLIPSIGDIMAEHPIPPADVNFYTAGDYADEDGPGGSKEAFLQSATESKLFQIHKEVEASYLYTRPFTSGKGSRKGRIDFILLPKQELVRDHGWVYGALGVECKKSGEKIGKAVCQCIDYRQAVYRMPQSGHLIMLDQVFIWPFTRAGGDIASVMAHHRIGGVHQTKWERLAFYMDATGVLRVRANGEVVVKGTSNGRKVGSR